MPETTNNKKLGREPIKSWPLTKKKKNHLHFKTRRVKRYSQNFQWYRFYNTQMIHVLSLSTRNTADIIYARVPGPTLIVRGVVRPTNFRFRILCSSWSAIWSNFRLKNPLLKECTLDCLLERSYHAQTHTPAAVDPQEIVLSVFDLDRSVPTAKPLYLVSVGR